MIFAHGPLGSLIARSTWKPFHAMNFSNRQKHLLLLVGFIGGIIPDIDLLYTTFIDGSTPHRALITHTMVPWLIIFVVAALTAYLRRRQYAFAVATVFFLGNLSHLFTDMIASNLRILFPFSDAFIGLTLIPNTTLLENLLLVNFIVECILIAVFCILLIREYVPQRYEETLGLFVGVMTAAALFMIIYGNYHVYKGPSLIYYGDIDGDGIENYADRDMDGDGLLNIDDPDSDGDEIDNTIELYIAGKAFDHVWYDPTEGGLIGIPRRLGFVSSDIIPWHAYKAAGIFIDTEMLHDFSANPAGYTQAPNTEPSTIDAAAVRTWLANIRRLDTADVMQQYPSRVGDLIFTNKNAMYVIVGMNDAQQPMVVRAEKKRWYGGKVTIEPLEVVLQAESAVVEYRGRPLYETPQETQKEDVSILIQ